MTYNQKAVWIDTPDGLTQLVEILSKEPCVAVDTESNSLFAYQEQVCLIQFSIPSGDYLVDPLALDDLSELGGIFADPNIEKVFHAAEYDVICLRRDFGFEFNNLFDTMIGARTLGWSKIGLGNLLEEYFNVKANKKYQRANWGERPIEAEMLDYARTDTHYLIELRDIIYKKLVAARRWKLADEYIQQMCLVELSEPTDPAMTCFWSCFQRDFSKQQLTVLFELCEYRETLAKRKNRPPFKVISKEILIQTALACPTNREQLRQNVKISNRQINYYGDGLIQAVKRGLASKPRSFPRNHNYPEEPYHTNFEVLKNWRKLKARSMGVESDVVLNRETLETIASENPEDDVELRKIMENVPYRYSQFGASILETLERSRLNQ